MSHATHTALQSLQQHIRHALALSDHALGLSATPEYPLMFGVPLPAGHAFDRGNVSIRFSAMSSQGLRQIELAAVRAADGPGCYQLDLCVPQLALRGQYSIDAIHAPEIKLDHGGSMMERTQADYQPGGSTGATIVPLPPEQQAAMLEQARDQKQQLRNTPNGQALLATFNEHNETFNTVFVTSDAARTAWAAGGVTQAMAVDTHQAIGSDTVVNSSTKQYAPNVTYNSNAFAQQLQIVVNTIAADPNFDPFDPQAQIDPDSPYTKASLAALTFNASVVQTGNDKANVTELRATDVYLEVQQQTPPPPATVDQLQNIIDQGAGAGGALATAEKNQWPILDEADRAQVRRLLFQSVEERLQRMNLKPQPLWQGACDATVQQVLASVDIERLPQGGWAVRQCAVKLPAFALEIDDAAWTGDTARLLRARLNQVFFIKRMLHEKVQQGLKGALEQCLASLPDAQVAAAAR